jgi:hypothetical protein
MKVRSLLPRKLQDALAIPVQPRAGILLELIGLLLSDRLPGFSEP